MLGRRNDRGRVAYEDESATRLEPERRDDNFDEPAHYDGPVHRRDEGELRPANIDGTPPGATPITEREQTRAAMPKPGPDLVVERTLTARGGLLAGPVITGMVVSFGAMALMTALIAALFVATDTTASEAANETAIPIGVGVLLVLTQFIGYMWGGYTAGRMARGSGVLNGLAVPLAALLLTMGTGAVLSMMGADFNFNMPLAGETLDVSGNTAWSIGLGVGIASLIAMIAGGIYGGTRGARWHNKLEAGDVRAMRREVRT